MRAVIFAVAAAAAATGVCARTAEAQPATSQVDLAKAAELYKAAETALDEGRPEDAARDFTAAYAISGDPIVLYKIGSAHEKAGDCPTAITYYQRYLDEARPEQQYVDLTNERIAACAPKPPTPPPQTVEPDPAPAVTEPIQPPPPPPVTPPRTSGNRDAAWLLVGGAITFVTVGAVLGYSTSSAEQDIRDLYEGGLGPPPTYDEETRERYESLVDEGERYERLSWISFGVAGACAAGAAIFFWRASREAEPTVTPMISPTSAGVSVRF